MARDRKCKIDWVGVEADYRAGILSLRDISARRGGTEGAIRKRAKRDGWVRSELKARIINRSRALVCIPGPNPRNGTHFGTQQKEGVEAEKLRDEKIVDDAVRTQVAVILQHRKHIRETRDLVVKLISELRDQSYNQQSIEQMIDPGMSCSIPADAANRTVLKQALSLGSRAAALVSLVSALGKLTAMERQAFGLGGIETETPHDPIKKQAEEVNSVSGRQLTDHERAIMILDILERAKREKQKLASGT